MDKQQLLKHLQEIEWDNFEVKKAENKFTFMIDTTKAIREERGIKGGTESGMKTEESSTISGTKEGNSGTKGGTINKILLLIESNNTISLSQLSKEIGVNRSAIQKHIENLRNKGIIRRDGAGKGGKWLIINKKTLNNKGIQQFVND